MLTNESKRIKAMVRKRKETTDKTVRRNRIVVTLSDSELDALLLYVRQFKAKSKTTVVREAVLRMVMERFVDNYPTLFGKNEMDSLIDTED